MPVRIDRLRVQARRSYAPDSDRWTTPADKARRGLGSDGLIRRTRNLVRRTEIGGCRSPTPNSAPISTGLRAPATPVVVIVSPNSDRRWIKSTFRYLFDAFVADRVAKLCAFAFGDGAESLVADAPGRRHFAAAAPS